MILIGSPDLKEIYFVNQILNIQIFFQLSTYPHRLKCHSHNKGFLMYIEISIFSTFKKPLILMGMDTVYRKNGFNRGV